MTITFHLWHLIPVGAIIAAMVFMWIGSRETGFMAGLFPGLAAFGCLLAAAMFMLGRWLS